MKSLVAILTIFADASSQSTLLTMFIIACIFVPIVLIYKFFVYRIFKGKVKIDSTSYCNDFS
jgi:cytochrome bd ubiquinol oxidase subunit II